MLLPTSRFLTLTVTLAKSSAPAPAPEIVPVANLRTSERRDFKRCPQRWWWGWREGLRNKGEPSDALWFGIGWHLVMAHWYCGPGLKRGNNPYGVWERYVQEQVRYIRTIPWEGAEYSEEKYVEAGKLGYTMLEHYFLTWGDDPDWHVIGPEQTFQVMIELYDAEGQQTGKYIEYDGTFDGVYRDGEGKLWLMEHKTAKAIRTSHLPMDDQAGSYWAVADATLRAQGLIKPKEQLRGIMYNYVRKAAPDSRPQDAQGQYLNLDGTVSKRQPPPHFLREAIFRTPQERNTQLLRVGSEATVMQQYRTKALPLFKNPTTDCSWDCNFFELCRLHEAYPKDAVDYKKVMYKVEDPYRDHRKSASGGD